MPLRRFLRTLKENRYKDQVQNEQDIALAQEMKQEVWKALVQVVRAGLRVNAGEIQALFQSGEAKTAGDAVRILSERYPERIDTTLVTKELSFDSTREKEIFDAFNQVFNGAGLEDKVVDALYELCLRQQNNPEYMIDKPAVDLAKEILEDYQ